MNDPTIQSALTDFSSGPRLFRHARVTPLINNRAKELGFTAPKGSHYGVDDGTFGVHKSGTFPWKELLLTGLGVGGAMFGGPALVGALSGGGGAAGAGAAGAAGSAATTGATAAGTSAGLLGKLGGVKGLLSAVGPIAAQAAAGRGEGRQAEALINNQVAQTNTGIDSQRLSQALRLALLGGAQDATVTPPAHIAARMPQLSGGLKPSSIANREAIIQAMLPRILEALMSGDHVNVPDANFLDHLLSGVGMAGSFMGALPPSNPSSYVRRDVGSQVYR